MANDLGLLRRSTSRTFAFSPQSGAVLATSRGNDPAILLREMSDEEYSEVLAADYSWSRVSTQRLMELNAHEWADIVVEDRSLKQCKARFEFVCKTLITARRQLNFSAKKEKQSCPVHKSKSDKKKPTYSLTKRAPMYRPPDFASWSVTRQKYWLDVPNNPDKYYMRFDKPGVLGMTHEDWTESEIERFRVVVRQRPPNGSWGLFSFNFPERTGAQCQRLFDRLELHLRQSGEGSACTSETSDSRRRKLKRTDVSNIRSDGCEGTNKRLKASEHKKQFAKENRKHSDICPAATKLGGGENVSIKANAKVPVSQQTLSGRLISKQTSDCAPKSAITVAKRILSSTVENPPVANRSDIGSMKRLPVPLFHEHSSVRQKSTIIIPRKPPALPQPVARVPNRSVIQEVNYQSNSEKSPRKQKSAISNRSRAFAAETIEQPAIGKQISALLVHNSIAPLPNGQRSASVQPMEEPSISAHTFDESPISAQTAKKSSVLPRLVEKLSASETIETPSVFALTGELVPIAKQSPAVGIINQSRLLGNEQSSVMRESSAPFSIAMNPAVSLIPEESAAINQKFDIAIPKNQVMSFRTIEIPVIQKSAIPANQADSLTTENPYAEQRSVITNKKKPTIMFTDDVVGDSVSDVKQQSQSCKPVGSTDPSINVGESSASRLVDHADRHPMFSGIMVASNCPPLPASEKSFVVPVNPSSRSPGRQFCQHSLELLLDQERSTLAQSFANQAARLCMVFQSRLDRTTDSEERHEVQAEFNVEVLGLTRLATIQSECLRSLQQNRAVPVLGPNADVPLVRLPMCHLTTANPRLDPC